MQARVFGVAACIHHAGPSHGWLNEPGHDVGVIPYSANSVWKDQIEFAPRAGEAMLLERVHDNGSDRDRALTCSGLRLANLAVPVGTAANMQLAPFKIDIIPLEATQSELRRPLKIAVMRERADASCSAGPSSMPLEY